MKKIILCSLLSLAAGIMADEIEQIEADAVREITYTITISHDDQYNKTQWAELVKNTTTIIQKAENSAQNDATMLGEIVKGFCNAIEIVGASASKKDDGIHGEMKISIADDTQDDTKCGQCPCTKFKGVCPCVENAKQSAESIRAVCNEQCQKTGCSPELCAQNGCVQSCNS